MFNATKGWDKSHLLPIWVYSQTPRMRKLSLTQKADGYRDPNDWITSGIVDILIVNFIIGKLKPDAWLSKKGIKMSIFTSSGASFLSTILLFCDWESFFTVEIHNTFLEPICKIFVTFRCIRKEITHKKLGIFKF